MRAHTLSMFAVKVIAVTIIAVTNTSCGKAPSAGRDPSDSVEPHQGAWLTANGSYEVDLEWESGPQTGMDNVARLTVVPHGDATIPLQNISVTPWMTVHGHGSGNVQPVVVREGEAGDYRVSNIFFVMSGPWDLRIELSNGRVSDSVAIPVEVPAT